MTFYDIVRCFLIYSFFGWSIEVGYAAIKLGKFVNRGFLNGPVCPIYGVGAVMVFFILMPIKNNLAILFLGSVLLTSFLEYITGYVLQKIFHDKWWDYSNMRFNINGYICLRFSVLWGLACVFAIKVLYPVIINLINYIPLIVSAFVICVCYALFITDVVLTVAETAKIKRYFKSVDKLESKIRGISDAIGSEIAESVLKAEKIKDNISEYRESATTTLNEYKENAVATFSEYKENAAATFNEYKENAANALGEYKENAINKVNTMKAQSDNIQKRLELERSYLRFKDYNFAKRYVFKRLSKAFPTYFDKNTKKIKKIREFFKK